MPCRGCCVWVWDCGGTDREGILNAGGVESAETTEAREGVVCCDMSGVGAGAGTGRGCWVLTAEAALDALEAEGAAPPRGVAADAHDTSGGDSFVFSSAAEEEEDATTLLIARPGGKGCVGGTTGCATTDARDGWRGDLVMEAVTAAAAGFFSADEAATTGWLRGSFGEGVTFVTGKGAATGFVYRFKYVKK